MIHAVILTPVTPELVHSALREHVVPIHVSLKITVRHVEVQVDSVILKNTAVEIHLNVPSMCTNRMAHHVTVTKNTASQGNVKPTMINANITLLAVST